MFRQRIFGEKARMEAEPGRHRAFGREI